MFTSERISEIENYVASQYDTGNNRMIGIICGDIEATDFRDQLPNLLRKYNRISDQAMDFFWMGFNDSVRKFDSLLKPENYNFDPEVSVEAISALAQKINVSRYVLLSEVKMVVVPVVGRLIKYEEAVIIDCGMLKNGGVNLDRIFFALVAYAEKGIAFSNHDIGGMFENAPEEFAFRNGLVSNILRTMKDCGQEIAVGLAIATISKASSLTV